MSYDYNHDGESDWKDIVYDMDMEEIEKGTYGTHNSPSSGYEADNAGCLAKIIVCILIFAPTIFLFDFFEENFKMSDEIAGVAIYVIGFVVSIIWVAIFKFIVVVLEKKEAKTRNNNKPGKHL